MQPCSLVIFGATGNLARRKLMPSLFQLEEVGRLPEQTVIVAFGRRPWERQQWLDEVEGMLREKYGEQFNTQVFERFKERLYYLQGDLHDGESVERLKNTLIEDPRFPTNMIFYMAIRPSDFGESIERLGKTGLLTQNNGWRRVVIEKPFGYDLLSAQALQQGMHKFLEESQITIWARARCKMSWCFGSPTSCWSRGGTANISITSRSPIPRPWASKTAPITTKVRGPCAT
jgi:glucose-6-phosphate 1-dehydrogenase